MILPPVLNPALLDIPRLQVRLLVLLVQLVMTAQFLPLQFNASRAIIAQRVELLVQLVHPVIAAPLGYLIPWFVLLVRLLLAELHLVPHVQQGQLARV